MKTKIKILILLLIFSSCKKEEKQNVIDENYCSDELEIIIDENRIVVNKEAGYGIFETTNSKDKVKRKSFKLTKNEQEKLFSNGFKLITLKEYKLMTKSSYAGQDFTLKLNCSNKSLIFHNSSLANWSKISAETKEIYAILKSKVNIEE